MLRKGLACLLFPAAMLFAPATSMAATIDFESFLEADPVGTVSGITFTNAVVLTSSSGGSSLNESEFPPTSGVNVAVDLQLYDLLTGEFFGAGPMILEFSMPVVSVSGYFTYLTGLTLTAFRGATQVDQTTSSSDSNLGFTELLSLASAGGITRIEILGAEEGASFTVDDIEFELSQVPEPVTLALLAAGLAAAARRRFA